jgi:hypothetical protein
MDKFLTKLNKVLNKQQMFKYIWSHYYTDRGKTKRERRLMAATANQRWSASKKRRV